MWQNTRHVSRRIASPNPAHVLVVDDHPLIRRGLQNLFSSFGDFKIIGEAADGEQGCELAQQLQPDVVLMDIEMPKMNGIEATRTIKAMLPHVIVIGLSINPSLEVADKMKAAGASAYLTKETGPEDIYQILCSALTPLRWDQQVQKSPVSTGS